MCVFGRLGLCALESSQPQGVKEVLKISFQGLLLSSLLPFVPKLSCFIPLINHRTPNHTPIQFPNSVPKNSHCLKPCTPILAVFCHFWPFLPFWPFWPLWYFLAISIHFNSFPSISNYFQPFLAVFGQFRPFWRFSGFITSKHYFR